MSATRKLANRAKLSHSNDNHDHADEHNIDKRDFSGTNMQFCGLSCISQQSKPSCSSPSFINANGVESENCETPGNSGWYSDKFEDSEAYESSSNSEPDIITDIELADSLAAWANECFVKHNALDKLLHLLQRAGHNLPSTARCLLKTPKGVSVSNKSGMQYIYLDIQKQLRKFVKRIPESRIDEIQQLEISMNIDGLPLFKSCSTCFWPILCAVMNVKPVQVFPIAILCGSSKPINLDFLNDSVDDINVLLRHGLTVNDKHFTIHLRCIVCDMPAKAMVKGIKLYSGYEGCDKCTQNGHWLGKMTYPETSGFELRTDESFRQQRNARHHHNVVSPFLKLPIDMIKAFPIDYQHQACLGVMRKLLLAWLRGKKEIRLSAGLANEISRRLLSMRKFVPKVFARKPRSLLEIDRWKATEFRLFLLYLGKLVLKAILPDDLYEHFLTLSVAISIAVSPSLVRTQSNYAQQLLMFFVKKCGELYGEDFLVYNIHSMIHIITEAQLFGSLDECSCFVFENYLQKMKKMVRSGRNPLVQVVKRLGELSEAHMILECSGTFHISNKSPNNAFILDQSVCCEVIDEDADSSTASTFKTSVLCRVYAKTSPVFITPCDSRVIGTYRVNPCDATVEFVEKKRFRMQAMAVEMDKTSICFMALLHDFVAGN